MKNRPWDAPIPQTPKFKDRKRLFLVIEFIPKPGRNGGEYRIHGEEWLSREDEIMYGLKGYELELVSAHS